MFSHELVSKIAVGRGRKKKDVMMRLWGNGNRHGGCKIILWICEDCYRKIRMKFKEFSKQ